MDDGVILEGEFKNSIWNMFYLRELHVKNEYWEDGHRNLKFKEVHTRDMHLGVIKIQVIFQTIKMVDIIKRE